MMIRINLLPVRQVKKVQAGQRQLLLFASLVLAEVVGMVFLYNAKADAVEDQRRKTTELQAEIEALKKEVGDYDQLEAQHRQLLNQKKVINTLSESRRGPVWMMRELSAVLSSAGRPTMDQKAYEEQLRRNPGAAINTNWNPRRLWLEDVAERGGNVTMRGKAKDYDDVVELLKRLTVSERFENVQLKRNDTVHDGGLKVVRFSLTCNAKY